MNIKDYLHLYMGCQCQVSASEYYDSGTGRLVNIDIEGDTCTVSDCTPHDQTLYCVEADISDVKPLLRPLSDISDDEAAHLYNVNYERSGGAQVEGWQVKEYYRRNSNFYTSIEFQYLLSKHFDLFGLCEAGLAIDKTTTNA